MTNKTDLIIFGCGDIGRIAKFYFDTDSNFRVVAFTVDRQYLPETNEYLGVPVIPFDEIAQKYQPQTHKMFVAISYAKMNKIREEKYNLAIATGYDLVNYISSRCSFLTTEPIGKNCFILEDNTVQPFVKIGNNVTLWSGNHIGHDSIIHDHTFISSHVVVSGYCEIGERCFIGVNATLRNSIKVGNDCLIAASASVMQNTEDKSVWVAPKSAVLEKQSQDIKL